MKPQTIKTIAAMLLILFLVILSGCKSKTVYVPVESLRIEYRGNLMRDSIYLRDSIFMQTKNDTVMIEKFRYLYKDRIVRDSIHLRDTIKVPYPVLEEVEVNKISGFQNFQMWCGRILLIALLAYLGLKTYRRFR